MVEDDQITESGSLSVGRQTGRICTCTGRARWAELKIEARWCYQMQQRAARSDSQARPSSSGSGPYLFCFTAMAEAERAWRAAKRDGAGVGGPDSRNGRTTGQLRGSQREIRGQVHVVSSGWLHRAALGRAPL